MKAKSTEAASSSSLLLNNSISLLKKKRKTTATTTSSSDSKQKEIDPENDEATFEDQQARKKYQHDDENENSADDGVSENRISMLRSLDESLTQGIYKGHTIRKEDLFDDGDDLKEIKEQEDYLEEIKRLQQLQDSDDEEEKRHDNEHMEEDDEDIMQQIHDIVEEDFNNDDNVESLKKILLQKPLTACNRLPQNDNFWDFVETVDDILGNKSSTSNDTSKESTEKKEENTSSEDMQEQNGDTTGENSENLTIPKRVTALQKDLVHLIGDMLSLQSELQEKGMVGKNSDSDHKIDGLYLQEFLSQNKEGDIFERIWNVLDESNKSIEKFRSESIERWATKTKIQSNVGGSSSKLNLKVINTGIIQQVQNALSNPKEKKKLVNRTHVKQFEGSVLGKRERDIKYHEETGLEVDSEIFDDKDFYQVLLKDLISEVGGASLGSEISFRRALSKNKTKKAQYTGRTKGKTIRYTVHNELVNFMAPNLDNEIPESATTLFANLFGGDTVEFIDEEEEQVNDQEEDTTSSNNNHTNEENGMLTDSDSE
ncbi:hypothetical protein FDP41_010487 [Naegleria fowleri]|uniref:Protein BFR2 n=1 Tax=Naegleria fowleri TaxID=5763 RepID=A0A6A5C901_NAEFO|nr:uncharacterized protein FDP41_010487 [Naegleria fowleri]KAF0983422.1 hypothetical protein FDP41_010487 [Naegleria fowleri]